MQTRPLMRRLAVCPAGAGQARMTLARTQRSSILSRNVYSIYMCVCVGRAKRLPRPAPSDIQWKAQFIPILNSTPLSNSAACDELNSGARVSWPRRPRAQPLRMESWSQGRACAVRRRRAGREAEESDDSPHKGAQARTHGRCCLRLLTRPEGWVSSDRGAGA